MSGRKSWKLPSWVIPSIISTVALTTVGLLVAFPPDWEWLGVGKSQEVSQVTTETIDSQSKQKTVSTIKYEQAKTLWDWLSLLGVPLSLALLAWWLQQLQQKRAEDQATSEKGIAEENQREEVLQAYFDRISTLLIDKNVLGISTRVKNATECEDLSEQKELIDAAADVIRARTLSILRRLKDDPVRKTSVLLFLLETEVIKKLDVNLSGADLGGANLKDANLVGANLKDANLKRADLELANLEGAKLERAKLERANLVGAKLVGANLKGANLKYAYLKGAKNILLEQIRQAENWEEAAYNPAFRKELGLPPERELGFITSE